jgi:glucose-1-phosphate cytidylyltransferase
MSDVTFDMSNNRMEVHQKNAEPWKVTLVDTGDKTLTGGRLKRVKSFIENDEAFCFTYGDGLSDIDISASISFHKSHGRLATVTAVRPPGRYGAIDCDEKHSITAFTEKPAGDGGLINGGFFILSPECLDFIEGDETSWEGECLAGLASRGQIMAFEHRGFWQPMDTLREKLHLEQLWESGKAPWKIWE